MRSKYFPVVAVCALISSLLLTRLTMQEGSRDLPDPDRFELAEVAECDSLKKRLTAGLAAVQNALADIVSRYPDPRVFNNRTLGFDSNVGRQRFLVRLSTVHLHVHCAAALSSRLCCATRSRQAMNPSQWLASARPSPLRTTCTSTNHTRRSVPTLVPI